MDILWVWSWLAGVSYLFSDTDDEVEVTSFAETLSYRWSRWYCAKTRACTNLPNSDKTKYCPCNDMIVIIICDLQIVDFCKIIKLSFQSIPFFIQLYTIPFLQILHLFMVDQYFCKLSYFAKFANCCSRSLSNKICKFPFSSYFANIANCHSRLFCFFF